MKKAFCTLACLIAVSAVALPAQQDGRPVALVGPKHPVETFRQYVLEPLGCGADEFIQAAPSVVEYEKYKAVVFLEDFPKNTSEDGAIWNVGDNLDAVRKYVREGGRIFIFGEAYPRKSDGSKDYRNLQFCDDLLGFSYYPKVMLKNPVSADDSGAAFFDSGQEMAFVAPYTVTVSRITTAEILATVSDDKGNSHPFATRNTFGKGEVFYIGTSPFRLRQAEREGGDKNEPLVTAYSEILQKFFK